MPIGDLGNKVSKEDVGKVAEKRNPPEYESGFDGGGFGGDSKGGDFDSLFGGGSSSTDSFGGFGSPSGSDPFIGFGSGDAFGGGGDAFGGFGSGDAFGGFGSGFGQQPAEPKKDDAFDKILEASGEGVVNTGKVIIEVFKSMGQRNADDFAYIGRNMIITGGALMVGSILFSIMGMAGGIGFLKFSGMSGQLFGAGGLSLGTGLSAIGISAIALSKHGRESESNSFESMPDLTSDDNFTDSYEDSADDIFAELFDNDDGEDIKSSWDEEADTEENLDSGFQFDMEGLASIGKKEVDYGSIVDTVREKTVLNREVLFNTFKGFFPKVTMDFAKKTELTEGSKDFNQLEAICLKALSNVAKSTVEEIDSHLEKAVETYFSYELRMKRVRGLNKTDDIARELEAYFRESSSDTSVVANVDIEGDFYKAVVTKGVQAVVTFGDMFQQKQVCDFFLNTKNKLPMITGITELGEVMLDDAKDFDTMMIAGKPRSGKSWYVLSVLMALMAFNPPEEVQFVIVDPKESNLFKTMALMPHVAGLHDDKNILQVMRDIIDNEGTRRKKILADNKCDDIWALRKKGIKLPVLYLVIDEVITVKNNLGSLDKEFDSLMQTIISQLPSQGIRIMFVPHRATGVVNKTNRTMIAFSAAVRADNEDVKDTLGIGKWTRALVNQGDVAVRLAGRQTPFYVKGGAITSDDEENTELITNMARAFYKMGVELPYMGGLLHSVNRNEEEIKRELSTDTKNIQFNANNVFKDI